MNLKSVRKRLSESISLRIFLLGFLVLVPLQVGAVGDINIPQINIPFSKLNPYISLVKEKAELVKNKTYSVYNSVESSVVSASNKISTSVVTSVQKITSSVKSSVQNSVAQLTKATNQTVDAVSDAKTSVFNFVSPPTQ